MSTKLPPELRIKDQPRRLRMHGFQWIGIPLVLLVPVLALVGVFGESRETVEEPGAELTLTVDYPARYRYGQTERMIVYVRNVTRTTLDTVVVAFEPDYVGRFSSPTFTPAPEEPFRIEIRGVGPGEIRLAWAELQGKDYGRHRGVIEAFARGSRDTARVSVSTVIFP